jgi:hypothetical protein
MAHLRVVEEQKGLYILATFSIDLSYENMRIRMKNPTGSGS